MPFPILNLILLLFGALTYFNFRSGVYSYCRVSGMSKSYFRKNTRGASNFWLYSQLHKQDKLGTLYFLNIIYLLSLSAFLIGFAFSWVSFLKIPVIIAGIFLGIVTIPVSFAALIYTNIEDTGRAFVVFKVRKGYNGKSRHVATLFDWLFCFLPLALYIFLLVQ